jgi:hypothetical protein
MEEFSSLINERIEALRPKLLDTSRRNPLINNVLTARTAAFVRIVDEKPNSIYDKIIQRDSAEMTLVPLPQIDIDPPDEDTVEFRNAFQSAQATDEHYLAVIDKIDFENDQSAIDKQENADRELKDQIRTMLDLPPRPRAEQFSDLMNHAKSHGINPSSILPAPDVTADDDRYDDDELQTLLLPKTFQSRMSRILSKARIYREERGLDVVYIVLGYLKWTLPNAEKDDEFKSPLLLIPVELHKSKSSVGEKYTVTSLADPVFNPALAHKLTAEAKLDLTSILEFVQSESFDVESLFERVATVKPKSMRWQVLREASFGVYPFQGIELYYDLQTEGCDFSVYPVIAELMVGKQHSGDGDAGRFCEADVESDVGQRLVPHIVLDADSSQFIALLKIANNENTALEGPPGSGKSQTIVNAIANAIYSGKRVLFVAQKVTALEVVFSRLQALGLDLFVLPMMGGFGNTNTFYEALERRLRVQTNKPSKDIHNLRQQLRVERDKLSSYIDVLTRPVAGTGISVHQVLGLTIAHHVLVNGLPLELRAVKISPEKYSEGFSLQDLEIAAAQLADWRRRLEETTLSEDSAWFGANAAEVNTDEINSVLVSSRTALLEIEGAIASLDCDSKALVAKYLDNDYESIQYEVTEASTDALFNRVHELSKKLGLEVLCESITGLVDANSKISTFCAQQKLLPEKFIKLASLGADLAQLQLFARKFELQRIVRGIVDRYLAEIQGMVLAVDSINVCQEELTSFLGSEVSTETLLAYRPLVESQQLVKSFKEYIKAQGFENAIEEIRKARSAYRSISQMLEDETLPDISSIKAIRDTIQEAGIFSFLSSDVKSAKRKAADLLRYVTASDSKRRIVSQLDELLLQTKELKRLTISDHIGKFNKDTDEQIANLAQVIDKIQTINNVTRLTEQTSLNLCCFEKLSVLTELIKSLKDKDTQWKTLEPGASKVRTLLSDIESGLDGLRSAEMFMVELNKTWASDIGELVKLSEVAAGLLAERKLVLKKLSIEVESEDEALELFAVYKDYRNMSDASVELTFGDRWSELRALISGHLDAIAVLNSCAKSLARAKGFNDSAEPAKSINEMIATLESHRSDQRGLNSLIAQRSIFKEATRCGFEQLLSKLKISGGVDPALGLARAAIISSLKDRVEKDYGSILLQFDGTSLSSARSQLSQLDRRIIDLSPSEVASSAVAKANVPRGISYGRKSDFTNLSLLTHELQKKRRTPPRKILKRAQGALLELFPCWMMVPSSVAQHLPRQNIFDLVIIDEASQMTPENSVSALMRGKNALVAGDTNQLPPTNFFKGLSADEEEDEDITTTEDSILELANIQFHPKHRLLWHYRSRHEDLIAFSNHYVYDRELVIFPSPNPTMDGMGISLVQVNGTFQRGINPAEAQVMLEAIAQFMTDDPDRSLGVAVMNQPQMEQLESLVLREAESNKAVSAYLEHWNSARGGLEKFFVKNLENVQGDERDVIFIGTIYGRDPQGKFYQRLGPINGSAGKRRLNVLFSRAKEQIVTFSSIPLSDFNPDPANEGATLLRRWLEFSATKTLGEVAYPHDRAGHTESPFEDHVIEAVKSLGYDAIPQIGVSSYFIDIGVKHPSYPYGYLCGIECDGASYHSTKSARDRDRLREEVLNRLGWDLYRIWSTDWFRDALGCRTLLKQYLENRLAKLIAEMPEVRAPQDVEDPNLYATENESEESLDRDVNVDDAILVGPTIEIGSRFSLRYLDGPRAGVITKFWFQYKTNDPTHKLEGYTTLGNDSPLGEAVEGAEAEEIREYAHGKQVVHVQILFIEE